MSIIDKEKNKEILEYTEEVLDELKALGEFMDIPVNLTVKRESDIIECEDLGTTVSDCVSMLLMLEGIS